MLQKKCLSRVLLHLNEFRIGGSLRYFDFLHDPEFQLVFYFGERIVAGLCIDDMQDAPFIKNLLLSPPYWALYNDATVSIGENTKRKLNLSRQLFCDSLADEIRALDKTVRIHPRTATPVANNNSQMFIEG